MMCDGSGELRYGLCRGCDACLGLTTPQPQPVTQRRPAPTEGACPWCNDAVRPFGHTDHTPQAVAS